MAVTITVPDLGAGFAGGLVAEWYVADGAMVDTGELVCRIESDFVLADHRKLSDVADLIMSPRVQGLYPQLAANVVERVFTVTNPVPKPGLSGAPAGCFARSTVRVGGSFLRPPI